MDDRTGRNTGPRPGGRGTVLLRTAARPWQGCRPAARLLAPAAVVLLLSLAPAAAQAEVRVSTVTEEEDVYLGESFFFQIRVTGGQQVEKPDLSGFTDFDLREIPEGWLRYRDGGPWDRFKFDGGTSFLYRLVALRPGSVAVPAAPLRVDGRIYQSPAVNLRVTIPPPSTDFRLTLSLSRREVFVGEPFELEAVWYYRKDGRYYHVNVPLLRHPGFHSEQSLGAAGGSGAWVRSFGPGGNWSGTAGSAVLGGISYSTFTVHDVIIPREAGSFSFLPSTVQIWVPREDAGSAQTGRGWNFDTTVVSAPGLSIRVLPLPLEGRPPGFSGIVSERLRIEAEAIPEVMNVGDPVTLRISLAGPPSLADAELPALGGIERLVDGFVLGSDPPAVELRDGEKIFRQTVRVKREDVTEIPPIEVSFFNTRTRSYQVAASRPYPITVRPTRIVTAEDLVGEETSGQVRVRSWDEGILHNVPSSAGLLRRDSYRAGSMFGRPGVAAALGLSLLGLVAALVYARRQRMAAAALADTEAAPIREASLPLRRLEDRLERAAANQGLAAGEAGLESLREALAALRAYLQTRLGLRPGRISAEAVETELERRGIEEALCQELRELLARQESLRFSGGRPGSPGGGSGLPGGPSSPGDRDLGEEIRELLLRTRELAGKLEQRLSAP